VLLRSGLQFWISLSLSVVATIVVYLILIRVLAVFGVQL
jgi:hypothetical protein